MTMEETKMQGLVETFDTGELSTKLIPPDFTDPDLLFEVLKKTVVKYHPSSDLDTITKAYELARDAHKDQKRKSGEPYLIHPVCVAIILAQLEMDKETIVGGLLHDVVEDTKYTEEDLTEMFSAEVAALVDGVTKLTKINYSADKLELQAENLRKMFLAMAKDIRVIIIKLADRLHNMRTMQYMKPEKQKEKSRETMDIYAPIADRLGISKVKVELDDLSLRYLEPEAYEELSQQFNSIKSTKETFVKDIMEEVEKKLVENHIRAVIDGRVKHLFSIYRKMKNQKKTLDQIYDLFAIRIIVNSDQECYTALGIIHEMYKPIPGRFKDYIAMPKPNNYQSLHTTLIGPNGQPFEIQLRTYEMHRTAEYGIAAHWKYKETGGSEAENTQSEEEKMAWLRRILEWQHDMDDNKEFLSVIKSDLDLFSDRIYCFTPEGDVKNLPAGSTPIDFAYAVHSAVGNKMVGARVNGTIVKMDYVIQNGDRIEIITSQNSRGPSRDWLKVVRSTQAKNKINQWFRNEFKEDNIVRGKELLHTYCKNKGIDLSPLLKNEFTQVCIRKYGFRDWESVCAAIGHGGLKEGQVVNKLQDAYEKKNRRIVSDAPVHEFIEKAKSTKIKETSKRNSREGMGHKSGIIVEGLDDLAVRFSRCCNPVPGDEIVGFVTRGRGVSVHRTDCVNMIHLPEIEKNRLIEAEWSSEAEEGQGVYPVEIVIYCCNRSGVLMDVSRVFTENSIDIKSVNVRTTKQDKATLTIGFETQGAEELDRLITKLRGVESVMDIDRSTNG
ncbi:MAG: bifunctional (p)ppGpp synthetase/guanosine-3',5'-bis(diphosphate) 3'-pyrophosphohydrolase [Eubacterium sp.]|jgi:(p)ppGpp synthetase, RelA/SpoT family|nr:bifunctional (p)ppGpp synthetase/guanosine-3',5'-bis(diphosphate) 3'-pyrophosphohydrolase [Eubacterium sp.]